MSHDPSSDFERIEEVFERAAPLPAERRAPLLDAAAYEAHVASEQHG